MTSTSPKRRNSGAGHPKKPTREFSHPQKYCHNGSLKEKTVACYYFSRAGGCRNGSNCTFLHGDSPPDKVSSTEASRKTTKKEMRTIKMVNKPSKTEEKSNKVILQTLQTPDTEQHITLQLAILAVASQTNAPSTLNARGEKGANANHGVLPPRKSPREATPKDSKHAPPKDFKDAPPKSMRVRGKQSADHYKGEASSDSGLSERAKSQKNAKAKQEIVQLMADGTVSVTFGPGFAVKTIVVSPSTTSSVIMTNFPRGTFRSDVCRLIKDSLGITVSPHLVKLYKDEHTKSFLVRLATSNDASRARKRFDGVELDGQSINCRTLQSEAADTVEIQSAWYAAEKVAVVEFPSSDSRAAVFRLPGLWIRGKKVKCVMQEATKADRFPILVLRLPVDARKETLKALFPACISVQVSQPTYSRSNVEVSALVKSIFTQPGSQATGFMMLSQPDDVRQQAAAKYPDDGSAESLHDHLKWMKFEFIGKKRLEMNISYTTQLRIAKEIYRVIEGEIHKLETVSNGSLKSRTSEAEAAIVLTVFTADRALLTIAKRGLQKLTSGYVLEDEHGWVVWNHRLDSPAGQQAITLAAGDFGLYAVCDGQQRHIVVYGSPAKIQETRPQLLYAYRTFLDSLLAPIPFKIPPDITDDEARQGLENLRTKFLTASFEIDKEERLIQAKCFASDIPLIGRAIRRKEYRKLGDTDCIACLCPADDPVTTECCHTFCKGCLTGFVMSAIEARKFPLLCFGRTNKSKTICARLLNINFIALHCSEDTLRAIYKSSLEHFVHANASKYYFCPTPNCTSIFCTTRESSTQICSHCFGSSCSKCRTVTHPSETCAQNLYTEDNQSWMKALDVRKCPKCGFGIQKDEGCNHMTCTNCRTHFCWMCGKEKHLQDIYDHMETCKGKKNVENAALTDYMNERQLEEALIRQGEIDYLALQRQWEEHQAQRVREERARREAEEAQAEIETHVSQQDLDPADDVANDTSEPRAKHAKQPSLEQDITELEFVEDDDSICEFPTEEQKQIIEQWEAEQKAVRLALAELEERKQRMEEESHEQSPPSDTETTEISIAKMPTMPGGFEETILTEQEQQRTSFGNSSCGIF